MSTWHEIGYFDEYIPLGVFWSGDWKVPEDALYAQTTGRDRLELLLKSTFSTSEVYVNHTLYDLAEHVLIDAGLASAEYFIDTELQDITVPYAYFEPQSHREALRKIAEACLGQVYCDRTGIVRIEGKSYLSGGASVITLTSADYFKKDNPAKYEEVVNYVTVDTQPLLPATTEEVYKSNAPVAINNLQVKTQTIFYNKTPCINAVATITGNATLTSATYYSWGASITVTGTATGTFEISVSADPLEVTNKDRAVAQDAASIAENGKLTYTFPLNPLVQTLAVAQDIADALLASFKDPRRDIDIDWRGNPALLLGDKITITDSLESNDYNVVSQTIEFDGALRSKLEGRKA